MVKGHPGLRNRVLTCLMKRYPKTTSVYDLNRDRELHTGSMSGILESFREDGLVESKLREKRNRIPYVLTAEGIRIAHLMEYVKKEKMVLPEGEKVNLDPGPQNVPDAFTFFLQPDEEGRLRLGPISKLSDWSLKLQQGEFSPDDWEKAVDAGLIERKKVEMSYNIIGRMIDPSKGPPKVTLYAYVAV